MMRTFYFLLVMQTLSASACQICFPVPRQTVADQLLLADTVVFAREDVRRPFHFKAVETLKGNESSEIDLFADSGTRRLLKAYSDRAVVIVYGSNTWARVGIADAETIPIVREALKSAERWEKHPDERIDFFAKRLEHKNARVRDQARLEVARAPYDKIRRLGNVVSREDLYAFLGNIQYVEWHPLYILLLAQTGDERDQAYIQDAFHAAARFGTTLRLAAWTTAAIEIDPEGTMDFLEENYFNNAQRKPAELDAVLQACSVHGARGQTQLRDRLVSAYGTLLDHHPAQTPAVARDVLAWKRTDLNDRIKIWLAANPGGLLKGPRLPFDVNKEKP